VLFDNKTSALRSKKGWWTLGPTNSSEPGREARGKASTLPKTGMEHGRWGVAQGCDCRSILDAIGTLIEAQRPDLAMVLIEKELNSHH